MAPVREVAGGIVLRVRLMPAGGADRLEGVETDAAGRRHLKVRVRVAAEGGKANAALEAVLAKAFSVAKSAVTVERGVAARIKSVRVAGIDADAARVRLTMLEAKL